MTHTLPVSSHRSCPKSPRTWWRVAAAVASLSLAAASAVASIPSRVFAPYIQVDSSTNLASISSSSGIKYFTLAFIIDDGTHHGLWEAGSTVASDSSIAPAITALRNAGGDVIISFGGEAGNELALGITSVSTLQSVYQGIINKYGVTALDFDIEGAALGNTSANDRRNQALAGLQSANPGLFISYTLPVDPTGLGSDSIALLQNAKSHGVNVACVNIMAMDYGSSTSPSMGQKAIDATNATASQLSSINVSAKIGITPLVGKQDTAPEVFTTTDAQTVENFAVGNSQVNRIAFWEVALDQCGSSCSGTSQSVWQFSHIFEPFTGGTSTVAAPTFTPAPGTYGSAQMISISSTTSGASIRYTTNGSTPSETAGTLYSGAVSLSATTTLKAIAYKSGSTDSSVTSGTYTISSGGSSATYEAESQTIAASSGDTTTTNSEAGYSNGQAIQYSATGAGDYITFRLAGVSAGTYDVVVGYKAYTSRAIVQVSAGTAGGSLTNVGSALDQYAGSSSYTSADLGNWTASATGSQDFKFAVTGHNASSSGYTVTIDYIKLTPTSAPTYTLTASAGTGGSIAPSGTTTVNQGANQSYTIAANSGYSISSVTVDGANVGAVSTYTFSNVQANHTISAAFAAIPSYTITASAGTGGSISPSGSVGVPQGASQSFTIAANSGYSIAGVSVDSVSVGAVASYTFSNVQANHTISATFSSSGGSPTTYEAESQTIAASSGDTTTTNSEAGYSNGQAIQYSATGAGDYITFRLTGVAAGTYDVVVGYKAYTSRGIVQVSAGTAGGALTNVGSPLDEYASGSSYTSADLGNWTATTTGSQDFKFAVTGHNASSSGYTVTIDYIKLTPTSGGGTTFTITASAGTGGTVTPSGTTTVNQGANQSFTIAANSGYTISSVTVDGTGVGAVSSYTFTNVQANHTISASFSTVSDSNIAPNGTAYGWNANTSSTANTNRTAQTGLNDNNLTADVDLDAAGDAVGAWEAAGVTWTTSKTISSVTFINGTVTTGGDGFLTAGLKLQFTTDGSTWTDSSWTASPTYPYSSSASGQTYTFSGTATSGLLGVRVTGQVRTTDTSYHWIVKEVQAIGH